MTRANWRPEPSAQQLRPSQPGDNKPTARTVNTPPTATITTATSALNACASSAQPHTHISKHNLIEKPQLPRQGVCHRLSLRNVQVPAGLSNMISLVAFWAFQRAASNRQMPVHPFLFGGTFSEQHDEGDEPGLLKALGLAIHRARHSESDPAARKRWNRTYGAA